MKDYQNHCDCMFKLSQELNKIHDILPVGSRILYLDIPIYDNIGDQLINLGAETFFKDSNYDVIGRYSVYDLCDSKDNRATLRRKGRTSELASLAKKEVVLVFSGGGNFGDLYPLLQTFRETIVSEFASSKVVVLPQSVHFSSSLAMRESAALLRDHQNLTICCRDQESLNCVASEMRLNAVLMPDMAHRLWGRWANSNPVISNDRTLNLLRADMEAIVARDDETRVDWGDFISQKEALNIKVFRKWLKIGNPLGLANYDRWYRFRELLIENARVRLSEVSTIRTDRLHGMIFGALLSRKVECLDNLYGKVYRYHRDWLSNSEIMQWSDSPPIS